MTPRRRIRETLLIAATALLMSSATGWAAPGDLDGSFGGDGVTITTFGHSYGVATAVAIQHDGKIVVAGSMHRTASFAEDFALVRLTTRGRLDRAFAGNGKVRTDFGGRFEDALAVTIQADGRILAAGTASSATGDAMAIARYNDDGSLDETFSRNGKRLIKIGGATTAYDLGLQSDGGIGLVGTDGEDFVLVRLLGNGAIDRGFGRHGVVRTDFNGFTDEARAVAIASDGSILAGGWTHTEVTIRDFALARYDEDGILDPSFGHRGRVTTDFLSYEDAITDLALAPTGRIVVSGFVGMPPGGADQSTDVALARYAANGSLDTAFGEDGLVHTDFGSYFDQAEGMALQPDGEILVGSHLYRDGSNPAAAARYEVDGDLDSSFGEGGIADSGAEASGDDVGGIALQTDGRIVVATGAAIAYPTTSFGFLVTRFKAS